MNPNLDFVFLKSFQKVVLGAYIFCLIREYPSQTFLAIALEKEGIAGFVFKSIRSVCKFMGKGFTTLIANMIVPFLGLLPTTSKLNLLNGSWRECREVVMVNISPSQLYFPTKEEVQKWFKDNSVKIISEDDDSPITFWGKKE